MKKQEDSINELISIRNTRLVSILVLYLIIILVLNLVLWSRFVEDAKKSLWITRCMLMIVPLEVIFNIQKIKDFVITTSKNTMDAPIIENSYIYIYIYINI